LLSVPVCRPSFWSSSLRCGFQCNRSGQGGLAIDEAFQRRVSEALKSPRRQSAEHSEGHVAPPCGPKIMTVTTMAASLLPSSVGGCRCGYHSAWQAPLIGGSPRRPSPLVDPVHLHIWRSHQLRRTTQRIAIDPRAFGKQPPWRERSLPATLRAGRAVDCTLYASGTFLPRRSLRVPVIAGIVCGAARAIERDRDGFSTLSRVEPLRHRGRHTLLPDNARPAAVCRAARMTPGSG